MSACESLTPEQQAELERIVSRFEAAWARGERPLIGNFLPAQPRLRRAVVTELAQIELEFCARAGEAVRAEILLERYPELAHDAAAVRSLFAAAQRFRRQQSCGSHNPRECGQDERMEEFLREHPESAVSLGPSGTGEEVELPDSALNSDELMQRLSDIELMSADELQRWLGEHWTVRDDPRALAAQLVSEGRLTRYQASALLKGESDTLLIDKYLILDLLDSGGMGLVFEAIHRPMARRVAIKMLPSQFLNSPERVKRFQREVRVVATLAHPNIVTAFDADESKGVHFLVMEYVDGQDLRKVVRDRGPLTAEQAVDCIVQAARGLQHAHMHGVVHRDVKPSNLMLCRTGTIKLLDLGLARAESTISGLGQDDSDGLVKTHVPADWEAGERLTEAGVLMGTMAFMAPEQALDPARTDHRADIYSLGCTLYFLLTGEPPFKGDNPVTTALAHRDDPTPSLRAVRPDVPESLEAVYSKMLTKRPEDRFQSMAEVIVALEDCGLCSTAAPLSALGRQFTRPRSAGSPTASAAAPANTGRRGWRKPAGAVLSVAVSAVLWWAFHPIGERRTSTKQHQDVRPPVTTPLVRTPDAHLADGPALAVAPFDAEQAKAHQQAWADHLGVPVEYRNSMGMEFRLIPPGEFLMGTSAVEHDRLAAEPHFEGWLDELALETPQHTVTLTRPFYLAVHEVTREQFRRFVDATQYESDAERLQRSGFWKDLFPNSSDDRPVVGISWRDAQAYCEWLSEQEQVRYVLPTEAQWEFACRAGTSGRYAIPSGDGPELSEYGWFYSVTEPQPVGQKLPNPFGCFDMHGNVWEWCRDWLAEYSDKAAVNPAGPEQGDIRATRGGSYYNQPLTARSAQRLPWTPRASTPSIGFRVAIESVRSVRPLGDRAFFEAVERLGGTVVFYSRTPVSEEILGASEKAGETVYELLHPSKLSTRADLVLRPMVHLAFSGKDFADEQLRSVLALLRHRPVDAFPMGVSLVRTSITSAGLMSFGDDIPLAGLRISGTPLDQQGIEAIVRIPGIGGLDVPGTGIDDEALLQLTSIRGLQSLSLLQTNVTAAGLHHLTRIEGLSTLYLGGFGLIDSDLEQIGKLKALRHLSMSSNRMITDAGLEHIYGLMNLSYLELRGTDVTETGVAALRESLPQCAIVTDFGTFGPEPMGDSQDSPEE